MKVLEIIQQDRAIPDFLLLRARVLRDEFGIETVFVSWSGDSIEKIREEFKVYEVKFSRKFNLFKDIIAIKRIRNIIRKENPNYIHTHFTKPGFIGRIASMKFRKKLKVIHQVHGYYFDRYLKGVKRKIFINLEKYLSKYFTDIIFFQNYDNLEFAKKNAFLPIDRLVYIGNGINLEKFSFGYDFKKKKEKNVYRIVSIGRLEKVKNHELLIDGIDILVNQYKIRNIIVDIIGEGPLEKKLKHLVSKKNLKTKIHFLGRQNNIPDILSKSDCLILTSYAEGKPRVVMEAMASGTFVIATDVVGTRDLIIDNITGFLIPINKPKILAERLYQFIRLDDDKKKEIIENARKKIEKECDEREIARKIGIFLKNYNRS